MQHKFTMFTKSYFTGSVEMHIISSNRLKTNRSSESVTFTKKIQLILSVNKVRNIYIILRANVHYALVNVINSMISMTTCSW